MVAIYATSSDLTNWMTPTALPANAVALLRSASMMVTQATLTAFFAVDGSNIPTDAVTKQAFNDATCAQAAAMSVLGIDPLAGGGMTSSIVDTVSIGSARVSYADAKQAADAKAVAAGQLTSEAWQILQEAGIQLGIPWIAG